MRRRRWNYSHRAAAQEAFVQTGKGPDDEGQAEAEAPPEAGADVLKEEEAEDAPEGGEESAG